MRERRFFLAEANNNFLLHIFTSLKLKRRFFKYMFTIHTLFLRLRFRLVRQEIPLRECNSAYAKLTLKRVQDLKVQMEELQWDFPIATPLSLNKLISLNDKKKWWRLKPGLAKRRALFPEGRGLGVGGRKRNNRVKVKAHGLRSVGLLFLNDTSYKGRPTQRSGWA